MASMSGVTRRAHARWLMRYGELIELRATTHLLDKGVCMLRWRKGVLRGSEVAGNGVQVTGIVPAHTWPI